MNYGMSKKHSLDPVSSARVCLISASVDIEAAPGRNNELWVVRLPPTQCDQLRCSWFVPVPDQDKVPPGLHVKVLDLEGDDLPLRCSDHGKAFQPARILARPVIPGASKYLTREKTGQN